MGHSAIQLLLTCQKHGFL